MNVRYLPFFCALILCYQHHARSFTRSDVQDVFTNVTLNYNRNIRPNQWQGITRVTVVFYLIKIRDIDEKAGKMSSVCYITLIWNEPRMSWNPYQFNGAYRMHLTQNQVWKPTISLFNAYSNTRDLGFNELLVMYEWNGYSAWSFGDVFETVCDINVQKFPFDTQTCSIQFVAKSYLNTTLAFLPTEVSKRFLSEHSGWKLMETKLEVSSKGGLPIFECKIKLVRRSTFYIVNLFCPILVLTFLSNIVFFLPPESGERIGYSVSCLLAIMVYLTLMADTLPKTSKPIPYLAIFTVCDLFSSTLTTLGSILSLRVYLKDDNKDPIPVWIQKLHECKCHCCKSTKVQSNEGIPVDKDNKVVDETLCEGKPVDKDNKVVQVLVDETLFEKNMLPTDCPLITWADIGKTVDRYCFFIGNLSVIILMAVYFAFSLQ